MVCNRCKQQLIQKTHSLKHRSIQIPSRFQNSQISLYLPKFLQISKYLPSFIQIKPMNPPIYLQQVLFLFDFSKINHLLSREFLWIQQILCIVHSFPELFSISGGIQSNPQNFGTCFHVSKYMCLPYQELHEPAPASVANVDATTSQIANFYKGIRIPD